MINKVRIKGFDGHNIFNHLTITVTQGNKKIKHITSGKDTLKDIVDAIIKKLEDQK